MRVRERGSDPLQTARHPRRGHRLCAAGQYRSRWCLTRCPERTQSGIDQRLRRSSRQARNPLRVCAFPWARDGDPLSFHFCVGASRRHRHVTFPSARLHDRTTPALTSRTPPWANRSGRALARPSPARPVKESAVTEKSNEAKQAFDNKVDASRRFGRIVLMVNGGGTIWTITVIGTFISAISSYPMLLFVSLVLFLLGIASSLVVVWIEHEMFDADEKLFASPAGRGDRARAVWRKTDGREALRGCRWLLHGSGHRQGTPCRDPARGRGGRKAPAPGPSGGLPRIRGPR